MHARKKFAGQPRRCSPPCHSSIKTRPRADHPDSGVRVRREVTRQWVMKRRAIRYVALERRSAKCHDESPTSACDPPRRTQIEETRAGKASLKWRAIRHCEIESHEQAARRWATDRRTGMWLRPPMPGRSGRPRVTAKREPLRRSIDAGPAYLIEVVPLTDVLEERVFGRVFLVSAFGLAMLVQELRFDRQTLHIL